MNERNCCHRSLYIRAKIYFSANNKYTSIIVSPPFLLFNKIMV